MTPVSAVPPSCQEALFMTSSPPSKLPVTVGELLRRRLREMKRSPEELAQAVEVPTEYIDDLIAGYREAPLPGRTDVYERMTSFLRLGRRDLAACTRAERAGAAPAGPFGPRGEACRLLLAFCEPGTAQELERRLARGGRAQLVDMLRPLLDVALRGGRPALDDHERGAVVHGGL